MSKHENDRREIARDSKEIRKMTKKAIAIMTIGRQAMAWNPEAIEEIYEKDIIFADDTDARELSRPYFKVLLK